VPDAAQNAGREDVAEGDDEHFDLFDDDVQRGGGDVQANEDDPWSKVEEELSSLSLDGVSETDYGFPFSFHVAGVMHVIHNALKDACNSMPLFKSFFEARLRAIAKVFSQMTYLTLFIESCLTGTHYESSSHLFEKLCPTFQDWRWASVTDVVKWLRIRRGVLLGAWKLNVMKSKAKKKKEEARGGHDGDSNSEGVDMDMVDQTIYSVRFWFFCDMLISLGTIPGRVIMWFNSCPCHRFLEMTRSSNNNDENRKIGQRGERILRQTVATQLGALIREAELGIPPLCPMRGKVGPEVAHGDHLDLARKEGAQAKNELLEKAKSYGGSRAARQTQANVILGALTPEIQDEVLKNFDAGFGVFFVVLEVKSEPFTQLPFALSGLAILDEGKAVRFASDLMARFTESTLPAEAFDRVTRFFLDRSVPNGLYSRMKTWIDGFRFGIRLKNLPALATHVAARRFIPMLETIIEQAHGKQKMRTAMKSVEVRSHSLATRGQEILSHVYAIDDFKSRMVSNIALIRNPEQCASVMGFDNHPTVAAAMVKKWEQKNQWHVNRVQRAFNKALYYDDIKNKFEKFAKVREYHKKAGAKTAKADLKLIGEKVQRKFSHADVVNKAWLDHFRATAVVGDVLELPASMTDGLRLEGATAHMAPVDAVVAADNSGADMEDEDGPNFEIESELINTSGEAEAMRAQERRGKVYLRIAHKSPGALHVERKRAGEGESLKSTDICFNVLEDISADDVICVCQKPSKVGTMFTRSLHTFANASRAKEDGGSVWQRSTMLYTIEGCRLNVLARQALTHLVRSSAWEIDKFLCATDEDLLIGLRTLEALEYVQQVHVGNYEGWCITETGRSLVTFGNVLVNPQPAFKARHDASPLAIKDLTDYEMLLFLDDREWVWKQNPSKRQKAAILPIDVRDPERAFFSPSNASHRPYLQVLMMIEYQPEALLDFGTQSVLHFEGDKYYTRVMEGRPLAIEDQGNDLLQLEPDAMIALEDGVEEIDLGMESESDEMNSNGDGADDVVLPEFDSTSSSETEIEDGPHTPTPEPRARIQKAKPRRPESAPTAPSGTTPRPLDLAKTDCPPGSSGPGSTEEPLDGMEPPECDDLQGDAGGGGDDGGGRSWRAAPVHREMDDAAEEALAEVGIKWNELTGALRWSYFTFTYRHKQRVVIFARSSRRP